MVDFRARIRRTGRRARTVVLILSPLVLGACSPICQTADAWTWATCYADIHGENAAAIPSEFTEPPVEAYADAVEAARALVRSYLRDENLPGLSIAAGIDGGIVWAEGFGWAEIDTRRRVTPTTRFRIGGVAQLMTAAAVGLLLERGELELDEPVQTYVPGFPVKPWPITIRQLMAHVAGIRHYDDEGMLYRSESCSSPTEALALFANQPLRFEPGTAYRYATYGWTLVGAAVESVTGESFLRFLQREVLDRAGMHTTVLDDSANPADDTTFFYWPYAARKTTTGIEFANNPNNTCLQGGDGLLSTPTDLVHFGNATLTGRLLRAETLQLLQTPYALTSGFSTGHGLGWSVQQFSFGSPAVPSQAFGHESVSAGGTTSFLTIPEHGLVVAVTTNASHARDLSILATRIADEFLAPVVAAR